MINFDSRIKRSRGLKKPIILGILFILLIIFSRATWNIYQKERASREILNEKESELGELLDRKNNLDSELSKLETERGIESEIRDKFGFIKEGEEVIILVDNPGFSSSTDKEDNRNIFKKILDWIF